MKHNSRMELKYLLDPTGFKYYQHGENPLLIIHSGTHGDEYEVIDIVKECLEKYQSRLPGFIYVPEVSPFAVKAKTRINGNKSDINRLFLNNTEELEVIANMNIFNLGPYEVFISIHEDPGFNDYYIYDAGYTSDENPRILAHNQFLKQNGINLLNGVDDEADPTLGFEFVDGYRRFVHYINDPYDGTATTWALKHKIINTSLIPDVPGNVSLDKKYLIVDSLFEQVVCSGYKL